jgi:acyl carrier protein phosphodiesterase
VNHLAHLHLASPEPGLLVGALEGDFHKGPVSPALPADIARGIRLHRAIDAYTDSHPLVAEVRAGFERPLRRFAGILVDLAFDHELARCWESFHPEPLETYNSAVLEQLRAEQERMSPRACALAEGLRQHAVLLRYREWQAVPRSAERVGMKLRRSRDNPLRDTEQALRAQQAAIESTFPVFYTDLRAFVADWRRHHP